MNRLKAVGVVSLVAYAALLATKWDGAEAPPSVLPSAADAAEAPPVRTTAAAAASDPAPGYVRAALSPPVAPRAAQQLSPVASQFRSTRDLKAFADGLQARQNRLDREEKYYLAKALETCAFALSMNDDLAAASEKRRRQFIATIPAGDPEAAKRIAAYDQMDETQRCLRFQGIRITQSQIEELYRQASENGDPRAQARMLIAELNLNLASAKGVTHVAGAVGQDDFQRIISLLETRDAEAMVMVAQFLAQHRLIEQLRIGPNGEIPEPASLVGAFALVSCDFEVSCPAFEREAQQACAYAGYCSSGSYHELFANFLASPWAYGQAMRYRDVIHTAIDTRNWRLLGLQKLIGARSGANS